MQNISKAFRISALEKQLESSAKEFTKELSRLRTKLFEMEMNEAVAADDGSSNNNIDLDDGTSAIAAITANEIKEIIATSDEEAPPAAGSAVAAVNSLRKLSVASPSPGTTTDAAAVTGERLDANAAVPPAATALVQEALISPNGGVVTKQDSVVDIDRIKTPPSSSVR
jgi:hypothetical protein